MGLYRAKSRAEHRGLTQRADRRRKNEDKRTTHDGVSLSGLYLIFKSELNTEGRTQADTA